MEFVISALHYAWTDAADACRIARDVLGLDGVEFSWRDSWQHPEATREDIEQLRAGVGAGLELSAHIWENPARQEPAEAVERLLGWVELAASCGVNGLVVHGGDHDDRRAGLAKMKAAMAAVLPDAEKAGVTLYVENHYAYAYRDCRELYSEPWEFLDLFQLPSPNLGFCYDTGHGHMTHNCEALLRELAPRLGYVHLADNFGEHDDHLPYGRGTVPWASVFDTLAEIGFDGTMCVEFPVSDDRQPFRDCLAVLRRRWPRA